MTMQAKIESIRSALRASPLWVEDSYGHFKSAQKTIDPPIRGFYRGRLFQLEYETPQFIRVKFQKTSVRLESQIEVCNKSEWMRLDSAFFRQCCLSEDSIRLDRYAILLTPI